jgi:3-phosphoshikimate 1-carboxyvinyltransferase
MAAAAITNSNLKLTNLTADQPDIDIVRILREMGAEIEVKKNSAEIFSSELHGIVIDAKDIPDLVPVCAVLACFAKGRTEIINAKRLRIKESDRLASVSSELSKMGGKITELEDGLIVEGPCQMKGTTINPHRDHRIAMACSVAALRAEGKTIITQAECVNKSYPNFFKDLKKLGANIIGG